MASSSGERVSGWFSESADMTHIYVEAGLPSLIPTERIVEEGVCKPDMFFIRQLAEEKKKKPLDTGSSTYKNQRDELPRLSKLNPTPPLEKKGDGKGKEKIEPSRDESLKKPIEAEPISALKIIEPKKVAEEEGGLLKRPRKKQPSRPSITEGKASSFLGSRSDEIALEVLEMLPTEVQSVTKLCHKYWTKKYSNYAETCDAMDMMEARLTIHACSRASS
ncbi:Hypothetical predicted protein [Olea europaea subsp. europaea]|uniref:Uncharacterized protein n=1 Tax=Olea europaea subsp. europaea TaxID=158383 RepID=A0A8S0PPD4_OLEEU|nr:Hypothetical predicted protein [Olea europaea subsp. europaea]